MTAVSTKKRLSHRFEASVGSDMATVTCVPTTFDDLARNTETSLIPKRPTVLRNLTQLLLDPQQLIILRHPIRSRGRAGFDLAAVGCHRYVGDRRVFGLATTVG